MQELLKKLKIDETYTKPIKNIKYDKVKENTYPKGENNMMAEVLFLPKTKYRYSYLFVIVDLWNNKFDIEPIRTKTPDEVLKALKKILTRPYITDIKASIRTDSGKEFLGVFHRWLHDENILHRIAMPNRHNQLANVENLNKLLGRLINRYLNSKEIETGKVYKQWTDVVDIIRKDLNEIRERPDGNPQYDIFTPPTDAKPKFKVGDIVFFKSDRPLNALGQFQPTNNFREGDFRFNIKDPRRIKSILHYPNNIRYLLENNNKTSYAESELKLKP